MSSDAACDLEVEECKAQKGPKIRFASILEGDETFLKPIDVKETKFYSGYSCGFHHVLQAVQQERLGALVG